MNGLKAMHILIEVNRSRGKGDLFLMVGLPDNAVRESRSRVMSALNHTRLFLPREENTTVNFAPADVRKEGSGFDLPLAIGLLAASKLVKTDLLEQTMIIGELGLDGSLRPVRGALPIAIMARAEKYTNLIVPEANAREAAVVDRLHVFSARTLPEVVAFLNGEGELEEIISDTRAEFAAAEETFDYDFADVKGQDNVKRAFEVAAAGGHNILLVGAPGCGKSMMAKRLPSILPPLTISESLETTQIHSVAGKLGAHVSLITTRPFRAPHNKISDIALIGGGSTFQPGEISLAHNGILFLDEFPEFSRNVLETLRQPLEDRQITIARTRYSVTLPCSFMLVAAMNPCPCGYYNHPTHACECSPGQIQRYLGKISGPLLDRIDIQVEVSALKYSQLSSASSGEPSSEIRKRVIAARQIQEDRYREYPGIHCNAQMTDRLLHQHCVLDEETNNTLQMAMERLHLSARAYSRILKVARTIADLQGKDNIQMSHIAEAIGYRNLDRGDWAERGI